MSKTEDPNIVIAVMSYWRADYLQQCLEGLANNDDIDEYDVVLFQDGSVNKFSGRTMADPEAIELSVEIAEQSDVEFDRMEINEHNLGVALQRDKVLSILDGEYDLLFQIENDIVLGPDALKTMKSMSLQFPDYSCSPYRTVRYRMIDEPESKLDQVIISGSSPWHAISMWDHSWEMIKDEWTEYVEICEGVEYKKRDTEAIFNRFPDAGLASSDAVCGSLLRKHGIKRVQPVISRANYIGRRGIHVNDSSYVQKPYGEEGPAHFESDPVSSWKVSADESNPS